MVLLNSTEMAGSYYLTNSLIILSDSALVLCAIHPSSSAAMSVVLFVERGTWRL
jgi:hypothetical protein